VPDAAGVLVELLELYWRGLSEPLKFFPETSLAFVEADSDAAVAEARKAWTGHEYERGEGEDEYLALCFSRVDPIDSEFALISRTVYLPLLKHLEVLK
jgi:exodeoxyribonuclease V gamma subunit